MTRRSLRLLRLLGALLLVGAASALQPKLAGSPFTRFQKGGVQLTSVSNGKNVALTSLWNADETCVVEMLRHYG